MSLEKILLLGKIEGKSRMIEDEMVALSWEDPLEKEMATHPSILVWENPWTEETGRLQSMGLQKNWT